MTIDQETERLAQPEPETSVTLEAWYMDSSDEDQRLPHRQSPNKPAPPRVLRQLGVTSWKLDADSYETDPRFLAICKVRGYNYQDVIEVSPATLPAYEQKIKSFYEEHMHSDEEIRFILAGRGYFDVRDHEDQWIRIACCKGDMIVLPEGIYHRFTLDDSNYTKAMRLFQGAPVWTPLNRPHDDHASRIKYLENFGASPIAA